MPPQGAEAFPFRTDTLPSNSLSDDAATKIPDRAAQQNNFGIGLVGAGANDNVIIDNVVTGNTNGIFLASVVSGNLIRRNLVAENAPVQVSVSTPTPVGVDIRNLAPADANTIVDNVCLTAVGLACPSVEDTTLRIRRERKNLTRQKFHTQRLLARYRMHTTPVPWKRDVSHKSRAGHPGWRRCSSLTYSR